MTTGFAHLTEAEFNEIMRLQRLYHREARKGEAAKAYLAGCVMLGAALEAGLIGMVHCFPDEVARVEGAPRMAGELKPLLRWSLAELLRVAKTLGWLPSGLQLGEPWDQRRAHVGDHAEVVRMLRNFVHPASYLSEHSGKRVTSKHFVHAFEVLEVAQNHLHHNLIEALRATIEAQDDT